MAPVGLAALAPVGVAALALAGPSDSVRLQLSGDSVSGTFPGGLSVRVASDGTIELDGSPASIVSSLVVKGVVVRAASAPGRLAALVLGPDPSVTPFPTVAILRSRDEATSDDNRALEGTERDALAPSGSEVGRWGPVDVLVVPLGRGYPPRAARALAERLGANTLVATGTTAEGDALLGLFPEAERGGRVEAVELRRGSARRVYVGNEVTMGDTKKSVTVELTDLHAWRDGQPGVGPAKANLHVTVTLQASGGSKGARVAVSIAWEGEGKSGSFAPVDDDEKPMPEGGFRLAAGEKRTIRLLAPERQKGPSSGKVTVEAVATGADGAKATARASAEIADVH